MTRPIPAYQHTERLIEVLGLQNQMVRRLVLVFDVNAAVTAYVERFVCEEEVDGVTDLLAAVQRVEVCPVGNVEVDERGRTFVPAAEHAALCAAVRAALEQLRIGANLDASERLRAALGDPPHP